MKRTWIALIGIPLWVLLVNLLNMRWYRNDWETYAWTSLLIISYIFLFWSVGLWWVRRIQRWLPTLEQTAQRVALTFGGYLLGVLGTQAILLFLISRSAFSAFAITPMVYVGQAGVGALAVVVTGSLYEFSYYFSLYTKALEKSKTANKALYNSELNVLKHQVSPHFLFNSLNILDSLIEDDPSQAREFLNELSTVYRYLLQATRNDANTDEGPGRHLTNLTAELQFIQSYFHLLKTRHGRGLNLEVYVEDRYGSYQLPPLTLQLLVENAVKHNIILPEQPLTITIEVDSPAHHLQVRNTLQKKQSHVLSNGVGLSNIMAKYELLGYSLPTIHERDGQFIVLVPLIKK